MRYHIFKLNLAIFLDIVHCMGEYTSTDLDGKKMGRDTEMSADYQNSNNIHTMRADSNWKFIRTDGIIRYVEMLLLVDGSTARYYENNMKKIKLALLPLMQILCLQLYPLNLRIIVVDVQKIDGYNFTLGKLSDYRLQHLPEFAKHDLAMLVSSDFYGGIAYVNGICGTSPVGICGFYPQAPTEYSAVLFHEIAHLFGVAHGAYTDCSCRYQLTGKCLQIDGYENDCSLQMLADSLQQHSCIQEPLVLLPKTTLPICGNGILEPSEECDCGPERFCNSLVCNASTCKLTISNFHLVCIMAVVAAESTILLCFLSKYISRRRILTSSSTTLSGYMKSRKNVNILPLASCSVTQNMRNSYSYGYHTGSVPSSPQKPLIFDEAISTATNAEKDLNSFLGTINGSLSMPDCSNIEDQEKEVIKYDDGSKDNQSSSERIDMLWTRPSSPPPPPPIRS